MALEDGDPTIANHDLGPLVLSGCVDPPRRHSCSRLFISKSFEEKRRPRTDGRRSAATGISAATVGKGP